MTNKRSESPGKLRRTVELKIAPESENLLRKRLASPEGQKLIDELALVYLEAAVARLIKEAEALNRITQVPEII